MGNTLAKDINGKKRFSSIASFRELGILIFIVVLSIVVQFFNKEFLSIENFTDMANNTAILAILSIGMLTVMLTGGIDLSIGSNMALSGMVAGILIRDNPTLSPALAVLIGSLVGLVCGMIIGFLVSQLNVIPIIASLGMNYIYRGVTFIISGGAWVSANQLSTEFKHLGTGGVLKISYLVWVAIIVFLIAQYLLRNTRTGRSFYATGSNKAAVMVSGINSRKVEFLAYSIMGFLAGICGALWVAKFASAQPDTATGYEVNVIAACVMGGVSVTGGRGNVLGVLLGALLIGIINNALPLLSKYISPFWQMLIQGSIILIAIIMNVMIKRRNDEKALARREI